MFSLRTLPLYLVQARPVVEPRGDRAAVGPRPQAAAALVGARRGGRRSGVGIVAPRPDLRAPGGGRGRQRRPVRHACGGRGARSRRRSGGKAAAGNAVRRRARGDRRPEPGDPRPRRADPARLRAADPAGRPGGVGDGVRRPPRPARLGHRDAAGVGRHGDRGDRRHRGGRRGGARAGGLRGPADARRPRCGPSPGSSLAPGRRRSGWPGSGRPRRRRSPADARRAVDAPADPQEVFDGCAEPRHTPKHVFGG